MVDPKEVVASFLKEADPDGWKKLPKGWTEKSMESFWNSWKKKNPEHPTTECIKHMTGKVSDPGAFCGGLARRLGKPTGRGKK